MIKKITKSLVKQIFWQINKRTLQRNGVAYGSNLVINGLIIVRNSGTISIGNNVTINSGFFLNPIGGFSRTIFEIYPGATLLIDDGVGISNSIIVARSRITIGKNTLIGGGTTIFDTDFHSKDWRLRGSPKDIPVDKPVKIGENAFVGAYCVITKGSNIGDRVIVPAGTVGRLLLSTSDEP